MEQSQTEQAIEKWRKELVQSPEELKFVFVKSAIEKALIAKNMNMIDKLLDELRPYLIGKENSLVCGLLKKIEPLYLQNEHSIAKFYLYCGHTNFYSNKIQEAKPFYQLAISYGTKYAQYEVVSFALGNLLANEYEHLPMEMADLTSRTVSILNEFDLMKPGFSNYKLYYHIGASYYKKQYSYCESLINQMHSGVYEKDSRNWLQLEFAKAGIYKSKQLYTEAFLIYEKYFQRSCEGKIDQRLYDFIVPEIKQLYLHLNEINKPVQKVKRVFDGYIQHSIQLQTYFMKQSNKEVMMDANVGGLERKAIFIEKANKALAKGKRTTFVCFDFVSSVAGDGNLLTYFKRALSETISIFSDKIVCATILDQAMLGILIEESEERVDYLMEPVFEQLRELMTAHSGEVEKILYVSIGNEEYELYHYNACLNVIHAKIYYELCRMV